MVNEQKNTKEEVIKYLYRAKGNTVSGVMISQALGISRVAVWKHITSLKQSGIDIESHPTGYALLHRDDLLLPFCFEERTAKKIFHFPELETTMDKAKELARNGAPHLSVVITEKQTGGRGRLNRKWVSSRGGLWFTIILKPDTPLALSYLYNFAASLCLSRTLRSLFDIDVSVKWPNDLLINGQKLAGLLSEMETKGDMAEFINIGIGININNQPQKYEPRAIAVRDVWGKKVSRKKVLECFLKDFEREISSLDPSRIIRDWKEMTSTIGSRVRIETMDDVFEGRAVDVDDSGALLIEDTSGEIKKIIYGDCFHT